MSDLTLITATQDYATFSGPNADGIIYWNLENLSEEDPIIIPITGTDTQGNPIDSFFETTNEEIDSIRMEEGKINPTKLFQLVAKVLKAVLCPECV